MDTRALNILNKIRSGQSKWDTTKIQDPTATPQATAAPQGTGMESNPLVQALSGITGGPPQPELDASQPLEGQTPLPGSTQSGAPNATEGILQRRQPQKQNFLGGGNGLNS